MLVHLTEAGRLLVVQAMQGRRMEIERIVGNASPRDRDTMRAGFEAFARAAGEPERSLLLTLGMEPAG